MYPVLRLVMRLLAHIFLFRSVHVEGLENVPRRGPVLVLGNHIATVDPPLTGALIRRLDVYYMAKSESFKPRVAWLFRAYHAFPVVRHSPDRTALKHALRLLAEGHVLLVYPEGSRSEDARLRRAYAGAGFIARHSRVPLVPVAIWGSEKALPKGARWPHHAEVHIRYGAPFQLPERNPDGTLMSHQQTADHMLGRVAAMLPERYRGIYGPGGDLDPARVSAA
jgi:1-acyl-sn-glycerol-3-phosphate acyltransferase